MPLGDDPNVVAALNSIWHSTSRSTVLLYGFQGGEVVHGGSGVLLRVGDAYFILTAAHVARAAFYNVPLFIASGSGSVVPLKDVQLAYYGADGGFDEILDIAVFKIPRRIAETQLPARRFVGCSDVDIHRESSEAAYLIMGYPAASTRPGARQFDRTSSILGYVGSRYRGEPLRQSYKSEAHILLSYSVADSVSMTENPREVPHPAGMSGCGIWRLDVPRRTATLVAIQSTFVASRDYAKGVWGLHALRLIWQYFPQVRPALTLFFPPLGTHD